MGDIVAPQTYTVGSSGKLYGKPKQAILDSASRVDAQIMPLVSNMNFSQTVIDNFLRNTKAQDTLIASLISEAQTNHYIGYQYDFEHIPSYDRDLYSAFVAKSYPALHGASLKLSIALAPLHSDNPSDYGVGSWQNWTGAFDYSALGQDSDFVSIMAYDDSKSLGPTASIPWITQVANYTLAHIPASKVSFGIPTYAWIDNKNGKRVKVVGYPAIASVLNSGKYIDKGWSNDLGVSWVKYRSRKNGQILTAWYEDAQSFSQKINLIKNNNMSGYSVWALGLEDPNMWNVVATINSNNGQIALR